MVTVSSLFSTVTNDTARCLNPVTGGNYVKAFTNPQPAVAKELHPQCSRAPEECSSRDAYARRNPPVTSSSSPAMTCYRPLRAFRSKDHGITFNAHQSLGLGTTLALPCGQCSGCRLMKSQEWQTRLVHESKCHDHNAFVTLTYDQENVPEDFSLKLRDLQLFMKRLRKAKPQRVRFFGVGEYGDQTLRPHYHLILFNCDFHSKEVIRIDKRTGSPIFTSPELAELWPFGIHEIGTVTPASAGYVARYCLKKLNGEKADAFYTRTSPIDGKVYRVAPEFAVMSRRPGIGLDWFRKHEADAFAFSLTTKGRVHSVSDFVVVDGQRRKPPGYYLRKLGEAPQTAIKRARKRAAIKHKANNTPERLKVREEVQDSKLKLLKRQL